MDEAARNMLWIEYAKSNQNPTIREKIILNTKDEIPHQCAVIIEKYEEKENIDRKAEVYKQELDRRAYEFKRQVHEDAQKQISVLENKLASAQEKLKNEEETVNA